MLSCSDNECSLWSVYLACPHYISISTTHVGNSVENSGYAVTELGAHKLNRKQSVHTHTFLPLKTTAKNIPPK